MSILAGRLCFLLLVLVACSVDSLQCYAGYWYGHEEAAVRGKPVTCAENYNSCVKIEVEVIKFGAKFKVLYQACEKMRTDPLLAGQNLAISYIGSRDLCNAKIAALRLTCREHEQLAGDILRHETARLFNWRLANEAQKAIGLAELRAVAGFAPPGTWTTYREPTSDEIAAAPTVEDYYELREPRSEERSLDSIDFFEKNFPPAIDFLDARFPAIRAIYRRKLEAIRRRRAQMRIDRDEVHQMIQENIVTWRRIRNATDDMIFFKHYKCK